MPWRIHDNWFSKSPFFQIPLSNGHIINNTILFNMNFAINFIISGNNFIGTVEVLYSIFVHCKFKAFQTSLVLTMSRPQHVETLPNSVSLQNMSHAGAAVLYHYSTLVLMCNFYDLITTWWMLHPNIYTNEPVINNIKCAEKNKRAYLTQYLSHAAVSKLFV